MERNTMSNEQTGLPMTAKWDPEKLKKETEYLLELNRKSVPVRIRGYFKLTGLDWGKVLALNI